jgi:hypothetical protein
MWCATADTIAKPDDGAPWVLCVKGGADGRSAYQLAVKAGLWPSDKGEKAWLQSLGKPASSSTLQGTTP